MAIYHLSYRRRFSDQGGFTLPELLTTMGVLFLGVLASVLLLRPASYEHHNMLAERRTAAAWTLQMLARFHAENDAWPPGLSVTPTLIGSEEDAIDLCASLVPKYAQDLPLDPLQGAKVTAELAEIANRACDEGVKYETGFSVALSEDGRHVTVTAPALADYPAISITR